MTFAIPLAQKRYPGSNTTATKLNEKVAKRDNKLIDKLSSSHSDFAVDEYELILFPNSTHDIKRS